MGLTIHYRLEVPADWTPVTIRARLGSARLFAKTLPVVSVSEIAEFHGLECDFQHIRDTGREKDDAFFWAKIQGQRYVRNPWEPGSSCSQPPTQMIVFTVRPAKGCEEMNVGLCQFAKHVWKVEPDRTEPKAWSLVFDKYNSFPEGRKIVQAFQRRWNLRRLPKSKWSVSQRFGGTEKAIYMTENCMAKATTQKGRYLSHRKGNAGAFGLVTLRDRMAFELCFRFTGTAEEAEKAFSSKAFQADLTRLVVGENSITPAVNNFWSSSCKTQFANDPRVSCGGWPNFVKAHLNVLALLEHMQGLGFHVTVDDEGEFWETRNLETLAKRVGESDAAVAALAGALKDVAASQGMVAESAMDGRPDFERLEAKGQSCITDLLRRLVQ